MIPRLAIVRQQLDSDLESFDRFSVFAVMDEALSLEQRFRTGWCATPKTYCHSKDGREPQDGRCPNFL